MSQEIRWSYFHICFTKHLSLEFKKWFRILKEYYIIFGAVVVVILFTTTYAIIAYYH